MSEPYRGWLVNANGQMVKPMNHKHMLTLMETASKWHVDPVTGEAKQAGGFRIPTQAEIDAQQAKWKEENEAMMRQEAQELRRKAPVVIMASSEDDAHEVRAGRKRGKVANADE